MSPLQECQLAKSANIPDVLSVRVQSLQEDIRAEPRSRWLNRDTL